MDVRKICILVLLLLVLPFSNSDIEVQTLDDSHTFVVNRYYVSYPQHEELPRIMVEHIISEATINPCESANLSFMITNPSNIPGVYTFSVQDFEGIAYITQDLYLSSKQSKIVHYILIPDCSLHGDLNPNILVSSGDEEAVIPLLLYVQEAYGYTLEIEESISFCNNVETRIQVKLSNLADFQNNYTLQVNKDWIHPEYGYLVIDKKSDAYFDLVFSPDFPTDSSSLVQIEVKPQYGNPAIYKFKANTQDCYSQEFKIKDTKICETDNIYVHLKNKGIANQSFEILSEGPFFLDQTEFNLQRDEEILIPLYRDMAPGKYDITLKSYIKGTPIVEEIQEQVEIISLYDCYRPKLLTKKTTVIHGLDTSVLEVKNLGYEEEYDLELQAPEWAFLEDDELFLDKDTTGVVTILTNIPEEIKQASYEATLILKSETSDNVYVEQFTIRVFDYTLVDYLLLNKCIIVFGAFLLIALVFFIKFVLDVGKKKAHIDLVILSAALILAFLLTILCFDSFKTSLDLKYHPINETENLCTTYFSQSICKSRYYLRLNEDSSLQMDLSEWFYDPDEDELEYEILNLQNMEAVAENGYLTFLPNKNWYGIEETTFTVNDGKGGFAESRKFFVHVLNRKEFNIQDFILDYHVFISLAFIGLLLLVIVLLIYGLTKSDK